MADPRFFDRMGPFSLGEIAERTGAALDPRADPATLIRDVASLDQAGPTQLSHFENKALAAQAGETAAGACLVAPALAERLAEPTLRLEIADPAGGWAIAAAMFYPAEGGPGGAPPRERAIAAGAHVDPSAALGPGVVVEAGAVIGAGAEIGAGALIAAAAVIGRGVVIGAQSRIGAGASISHALIGERVIVHPGARLGQDGFGFAMGLEHKKIPQLGRVIVENDAEIGANTTIDRGAAGDTVIGVGAKIDNLVQIGHNAKVGAGCVIVAQSGISGSAVLGPYVVLGAQCGLAGHLEIGPQARFAARSGVPKSLPGGQDYGGSPAKPARQWRRELAAVNRLGKGK